MELMHPEEDKIFEFAMRLLPEEEFQRIEIHVKECGTCYSKVQSIISIDTDLRNLEYISPTPEFAGNVISRLPHPQKVSHYTWFTFFLFFSFMSFFFILYFIWSKGIGFFQPIQLISIKGIEVKTISWFLVMLFALGVIDKGLAKILRRKVTV